MTDNITIKFLLTLLLICNGVFIMAQPSIDIQGHRGARGLLPENSLPGFQMAIELGVNTLEIDVIISKDRQVVVSHEAWLNPSICLDPAGDKVERKSFNLYQKNYSEIKKCDCGSMGNSNFPEQEKMVTYKPLLTEVIAASETLSVQLGKTIHYNIEIKTEKGTEWNPPATEFTELVYDVIREVPIERVNVQSFDFEILRTWRKNHPKYRLAVLISNIKSWEKNIEDLGFQPDIYSPSYRLLTKKSIKEIQATGMKVIPWTINKEEDIQKFISWGVDGIITDYPDRAIEILSRYKNQP